MRLFVDGEEVAATYDPETGIVSYTPSTKLSRGEHTVRVEATDQAGNETERSWSFRVVK